jgi:hypothetical protein
MELRGQLYAPTALPSDKGPYCDVAALNVIANNGWVRVKLFASVAFRIEVGLEMNAAEIKRMSSMVRCPNTLQIYSTETANTRVYPKVSGGNEIHSYNNKHSLRSNTKGYGGKTH